MTSTWTYGQETAGRTTNSVPAQGGSNRSRREIASKPRERVRAIPRGCPSLTHSICQKLAALAMASAMGGVLAAYNYRDVVAAKVDTTVQTLITQMVSTIKG